MRLMKIICPRRIELIDKLNTCLKMRGIQYITFNEGDCFVTYINDKDFNSEQTDVFGDDFEFEYESDIYVKDEKTYLDTGISHKLLEIEKYLEEGFNMTNGYQPKDCVIKPCPPRTGSKVGVVGKLKCEGLFMNKAKGYKVVMIDVKDDTIYYDIAVFGEKSHIVEGVQLCENFYKSVTSDKKAEIEALYGKELQHNFINDLMVFL